MGVIPDNRTTVDGPDAAIQAGLRTVRITTVVLFVLMAYGVYEVISGEPIQALILTVLSAAAAGLMVYVRRAVRSGNLNRSEEHTSELQSRENLVCRLLLEK